MKTKKKVKKTAKKASRSARERQSALGPLDIKHKLEAAFRERFPHDTVDISDGYKGNVHVLVVSRKFDHMSDYDRDGLLREIIDGAGLTAPQKGKISLLLALSPGEIK